MTRLVAVLAKLTVPCAFACATAIAQATEVRSSLFMLGKQKSRPRGRLCESNGMARLLATAQQQSSGAENAQRDRRRLRHGLQAQTGEAGHGSRSARRNGVRVARAV